MQIGMEDNRGTQNTNASGAVVLSPDGQDGPESPDLADVDMQLFRALRKLNTPKQRVCSALWLSYAEYDELAARI